MMLGRIHLERKWLCCWKRLEDHSLHSCLHAQVALFSIPRRKVSLSLTAWPQIPPDKVATTADSLQNGLRPRWLVWEHFFYTCPCEPACSSWLVVLITICHWVLATMWTVACQVFYLGILQAGIQSRLPSPPQSCTPLIKNQRQQK